VGFFAAIPHANPAYRVGTSIKNLLKTAKFNPVNEMLKFNRTGVLKTGRRASNYVYPQSECRTLLQG